MSIAFRTPVESTNPEDMGGDMVGLTAYFDTASPYSAEYPTEDFTLQSLEDITVDSVDSAPGVHLFWKPPCGSTGQYLS
jgi:hypothetical protein